MDKQTLATNAARFMRKRGTDQALVGVNYQKDEEGHPQAVLFGVFATDAEMVEAIEKAGATETCPVLVTVFERATVN